MVSVKIDEKESEAKDNNNNSNNNNNKNNKNDKNTNNNNLDSKVDDNNVKNKNNDKTLQLGTLGKGHQNTDKIQTPQDLERNPTDAQMQLYNVLKVACLVI